MTAASTTADADGWNVPDSLVGDSGPYPPLAVDALQPWICARCHPPAALDAMAWHEVSAEARDV